MGASYSSDAVRIHLDRDTYCPGETVKGVVDVCLEKSLPAKALLIKVKGSESSIWWESYGQGSWRHAAKREFFAATVPLASYEGELKPGRYQYPFMFKLPKSVPGSLRFKACNAWPNYHSIKGIISYEVEAVAEVPGMFKKDPRFTAEVVVQPHASSIVEETTATRMQKVKTVRLFDKGTVHMTATADKNAYQQGDVATVVIEVHNQSQQNFSSTILGVRKSTTLSTECSSMVANDIISSTSAQGVDHGATYRGTMSVKIPEDAQLSTAGQLLACEYSLEIKLKAGTFTSDARLHVPITVYKGATVGELNYPRPAIDGHVQVLPTIEVELPDVFPLPNDNPNMRLKAE